MGELNGRADISSWRMLLEEPVDLLHIPTWPAPAKILVDPTSFGEELRALGRPIASYLADILQLFAAEDGQSERKKELWDPACIAAVADPGAITSEPLAVPTLDAAGAHDFTQPGREVDVVSDLDERRVLAGLMEALARHRVGDDAAVIEGQFDGVGVEDFDLGGVGGGLHLAAKDAGKEGDADIVAARVAVWLGVNSDEARDLHDEARLLRGLAHSGLIHCLPHVNKATWQRPLPLEGVAASADQDHPRLRGDHHVDHQLRGLWFCQNSYLLRVRRIERLCRVVAGCIMLVRAARGNGLDHGPHPGRLAPHGDDTVHVEDRGFSAKEGMLWRVAGIYT